MRIADKWMKGQGMPADQIAQIHQNVATFYASNWSSHWARRTQRPSRISGTPAG